MSFSAHARHMVWSSSCGERHFWHFGQTGAFARLLIVRYHARLVGRVAVEPRRRYDAAHLAVGSRLKALDPRVMFAVAVLGSADSAVQRLVSHHGSLYSARFARTL